MTNRPQRRRKLRWRLLRWLALAWLLSLLPVIALAFIDPPTSAYMLARQWQGRNEPGFILRYQWADLERISPQLPIALVAAEDQNFPNHHGFDLDAISSVLARRGSVGQMRGASTISQQLAKNLFLWDGRSWLRKGIEAYYTLAIELLWSKRRILEVYVNIVEFGDGVYGAQAAAQRFFGVSAANLSARQAAALAAVLPNPKRFHVDAPSAYQLRRRAWIERQVRQLGGPTWLQACCESKPRTR
ncbi:MAG TPA: monofunctional biosynthetic peptidoglycan transglycosylase [Chiayiivirga sp.]|nr:monofunctional biosynthetic peptidoglycan transglycosylase [Chiayiivirga sp.]